MQFTFSDHAIIEGSTRLSDRDRWIEVGLKCDAAVNKINKLNLNDNKINKALEIISTLKITLVVRFL